MQDRVQLAGDEQVLGDVLMDEGEARLTQEVGEVVLLAGQEVVEADDVRPRLE